MVNFILKDKELIVKGNNIKKSLLDKLTEEQIISKDLAVKREAVQSNANIPDDMDKDGEVSLD